MHVPVVHVLVHRPEANGTDVNAIPVTVDVFRVRPFVYRIFGPKSHVFLIGVDHDRGVSPAVLIGVEDNRRIAVVVHHGHVVVLPSEMVPRHHTYDVVVGIIGIVHHVGRDVVAFGQYDVDGVFE